MINKILNIGDILGLYTINFLLFAMADVFWSGLFSTITAILLGYLSYRTNLQDTKLKKIEKTGEQTHILVNSNMAVQLKISAIALRRLANMPKATEEDRVAADLAEKALIEHNLKQEHVDSKEKGV